MLNPPRAASLSGPLLSVPEWRSLAHRFGFRCQPWSSDDAPDQRLSNVLRVGSRVIDQAGVPPPKKHAAVAALARYVGTPLLGLTCVPTTNGPIFFEPTDTRVESLSARVVDVERALVVTGATSTQEVVIRSSLQGYRSYLASLHLQLGEFPRVEVTRGDFAYPDPAGNRLVIGAGLANDPDAALHEYTHWVLEEAVDSPRADWEPGLRAIEAGLAYYLPRSFANTSSLGFLDILRPNPALAPNDDHRVGQRAAGTLWELRQDVPPHLLDEACAEAWLGSASAEPSASEAFGSRLGAGLENRTGDSALRARASGVAVVARDGSPGRGADETS